MGGAASQECGSQNFQGFLLERVRVLEMALPGSWLGARNLAARAGEGAVGGARLSI